MLLSPAGCIFLGLVALRGILVHSWDTLNQSMLALALLATLIVAQFNSAPPAAWLIGPPRFLEQSGRGVARGWVITHGLVFI